MTTTNQSKIQFFKNFVHNLVIQFTKVAGASVSSKFNFFQILKNQTTVLEGHSFYRHFRLQPLLFKPFMPLCNVHEARKTNHLILKHSYSFTGHTVHWEILRTQSPFYSSLSAVQDKQSIIKFSGFATSSGCYPAILSLTTLGFCPSNSECFSGLTA